MNADTYTILALFLAAFILLGYLNLIERRR